jgi:hypothetical protein
VSGLFSSCATPAASTPSATTRWASASRASCSRSAVTSREITTVDGSPARSNGPRWFEYHRRPSGVGTTSSNVLATPGVAHGSPHRVERVAHAEGELVRERLPGEGAERVVGDRQVRVDHQAVRIEDPHRVGEVLQHPRQLRPQPLDLAPRSAPLRDVAHHGDRHPLPVDGPVGQGDLHRQLPAVRVQCGELTRAHGPRRAGANVVVDPIRVGRPVAARDEPRHRATHELCRRDAEQPLRHAVGVTDHPVPADHHGGVRQALQHGLNDRAAHRRSHRHSTLQGANTRGCHGGVH